MRTTILICILTSVFVSGLAAQSELAGKPAPLDNIEITAKKAGQPESTGGKLLFTLRNPGSQSVKVMEDYLPWKTTSVLKLVAIPVSGGLSPIEPAQLLVDPTPTVLEITANAELHGELDVSPFFPRWKEITKRGMLLVWSFSLYDVETGYDKRFSGVIEYRAKR